MSSALALVIFDCDGVLVDSEPIANRVLTRYLVQLGIPHTEEECDVAYRGLSMRSMIEKIEDRSGRRLPGNFENELQAETYAEFEKNLKAVVGVERCVQQLLEKGIPICVASSGGYEKMRVTLGITRLQAYFSGNIFSAVDVDRGKPHPDLFLYAAEKMGAAPERTVVIEDSLPGFQAALAAEMNLLAYCSQPLQKQQQKQNLKSCEDVDRFEVIDHMDQVLPRLQRKFQWLGVIDRKP